MDIELIAHTRDLAQTLEKETGVSTGFVNGGGLFVASSQERLYDYQRLATLGKYFGIESTVLSPSETKDLCPLMNIDDMYGSLHSPGDGTIDPTGWVNALISGARKFGSIVLENAPVKAIHTVPAVHSVHTKDKADRKVDAVELSNGDVIRTEVVINCAGAWAPTIGAMVGIDVPLCAMRHAYVITEAIPGIENMPNVRDHDASVYLKIHGKAIHIGGYEKNPIFWKDIQQDFPFALFDLDWNVFSAHIEGAVNRLPVLESTGIRSTVCGPESFTSDHKPLMGPVPGVDGFYLVSSRCYSIFLNGGSYAFFFFRAAALTAVA